MENKELTIMEQFLIDEIDMICECCYDDEEIELTDEKKYQIARNLINYDDDIWEMLNDRIREYIDKEVETDEN